jgi:hypothetical protein
LPGRARTFKMSCKNSCRSVSDRMCGTSRSCRDSPGAYAEAAACYDSRRSHHSIQSGPNSSIGWGVRMVPLPHARSSAGQYLSHPQQMRSGFFGCSGARGRLESLVIADSRLLKKDRARSGRAALRQRNGGLTLRRLEVGGWRLEVGGWKLEVGTQGSGVSASVSNRRGCLTSRRRFVERRIPSPCHCDNVRLTV